MSKPISCWCSSVIIICLAIFLCIPAGAKVAKPSSAVPTSAAGATIQYQLPTDGPLPTTYCVTLAIVEAKNPDWIVSQFACAVPRTVTAENAGKFTETWNGLDDNFMPVPPGEYAVKGIYMPVKEWPVDKEFHSITPLFAGGASSWMPSPDQPDKPEPFGGDPCGAPLADVAVGADGIAVFYYQYLENGLNCPMFDLKKPVGYDQFLRAFPSGGAGGGSCATTDGQTIWAFSTDGGPKFVYRADGKSFGKSIGANRANSYLPQGWVTAMANGRDPRGKILVFVAQRGKIIEHKTRKKSYLESDSEFIDTITLHDGETGKVLAESPIARPQGLAAQSGTLYVLHLDGNTFAVSAAKIEDGALGKWQRLFTVPEKIKPADLEVDSHNRFYLSDTRANKVFQLDRSGAITRTFGKLDAQKPGAFDRETFMAPGKLATWTDPQGNDRLLVVENAGPNRVSEWSADGAFIRDFLSLQTKSNDGYGIDPEHPEHIYLPGQQHWLTRFKADYDKHTFTVDAVWPFSESDPRSPILDRAKLVRAHGKIYLCGRRSHNVFRLDADRCTLSAAILSIRKDPSKPTTTYALWHDANNNGKIDDDEITPIDMPNGLLTYHGQNWLDDLSFVAVHQGGNDVWRIATSGFDAHGNPILARPQRLFADPVFEARAAGKADAIHGGNELADNFPSDWSGADGSLKDGFYVQARGGRNFSANEGPQHKISRYVPDGKGGYALKWRTGKTAMQRLAESGEMYGAMRVVSPINGLVSIIDQSRCGILLFTEDGLYVDTIFPDGRRFPHRAAAIYSQPGEFFAGHVYSNQDNGRIYIAMGKYTPTLFEVQGWSLKENPVRPLTTLQKTVSLAASQIASPPEIALAVRGGSGAARIARFTPALGKAALDGSLTGWESCEPVQFESSKEQNVEVRCMYDPDHLYFRWHARLGAKFDARTMPAIERIFTHDQQADTLSFYFQGGPNAKPGGKRDGRPGDVRIAFGLFRNADKVQPVAVGFYPQYTGIEKANPQTYRTPVGQATFAHVGAIPGAELGHAIDTDGKGFVLVAIIPRAAIPMMSDTPFTGGYRTLVNFEATFAGHNKFWWANSDGSASRETYDERSEASLYPGSWAPAQFQGITGGITIRNWLICGPFGGPGAERFIADPRGPLPGINKDAKQAVREFCEAAAYPPDNNSVDLSATYKGDMIRGYWPDPRQVRWQPATVAELDTRVILGASAQVWYGATWVHVPADTELTFRFQSHRMTYLRWFINGQAVPSLRYEAPKDVPVPVATANLTLKAGWNQITFRGYCTGYPRFRAGLILDGPSDKLWKLQLSANPPRPAK